MKKNLKNKIALIVAVLLICLYGIFGIPSGVSGKALLDAMSSRIHLGLDLRGGAHLILQVKVEEAVSEETDNTVVRVQQDLKAANLTFSQVYKPDPAKVNALRVEGITQANVSAVRSLLDTKYSGEYDLAGGGSDSSFTLTMKPLVQKALEEKTVQQAIETIRDRVDSLGVSEPLIQEYNLGANQILVELPGVSDTDRVKSIIQSTARLEIHAVAGGPYQDESAALASIGGAVPPDQMLVHGSGTLATGSDADSVYVLQRVSVVAGSDFRSADPGTDQNGMRVVRFTLTNEAGDKFYEYTSANVGKSMAVVMGGRVREVANIKSAIRDSGEIEGSFSPTEVEILSKMLRTGALPASLEYLEDRTVGASLGADSVRQGVTAAIVGVLVVMAFMLVYYRSSGINADLALFLNLVILLGFMGFSKATLTLPGIAGVILTIGMGVDSNVLIFERIREEMRAGKAPSAAVDQGFAHAWVTIVDTHVTTIVSAAILFLFGSGPVKGFAVTLTFGLLANLFTAVFVSRVIFEGHLNKLKPGEMVSI
ncbi:MAG: protein translocase subunit SecD [Terracidiphilus sp.]|nr:protein translocase subunit SecD [Terracidiphilus sp.]MDR3777432.1 protein translocase subunit SecD [Terracidiphilus sp.]